MNQTQVGILNLPRNAAHPGDKVLRVFNRLKRKVERIPPEPNLNELGEVAMNSYRMGDLR